MKYKPVVTFCPMAKHHTEQILDIEQRTFENPWDALDFYVTRKSRNGGVIVAERRWQVIGYCAYSVQQRKIQIHNLAVDYDYRRQGIGSSLVSWVRDSLLCGRRRVTAIVRERNLDAQMFFSKRGFRALGIIPDYYDDADEDAYRFTWCYWGENGAGSGATG